MRLQKVQRVCMCTRACVVCTRIFGILQLSGRPGEAGEAGRKGAPGSELTGPPSPPQTLSSTTYWADSHRQLQLHLPMFFPGCNFNPSGVPPTEAGAANSLKGFEGGNCRHSFFSRQFHLSTSPLHEAHYTSILPRSFLPPWLCAALG